MDAADAVAGVILAFLLVAAFLALGAACIYLEDE